MASILKQYWLGFLQKVMENLASAKVWFFLLPFFAATIALGVLIGFDLHIVYKFLQSELTPDKLTIIIEYIREMREFFAAYLTFNVSLAGTIVVVRETFKISKITALKETTKEKIKKEKPVRDNLLDEERDIENFRN